jgi:glycosyltransferase involved in cell wall biosynthesis
MNVFMLGWEFPPVISGGLGTACYGLTKAMSRLGMNITFVLPIASQSGSVSYIKMLGAEGHIEAGEQGEFQNVRFRTVTSTLRPYASCDPCDSGHGCSRGEKKIADARWKSHLAEQAGYYGGDIFEQIKRYADKAGEIAGVEAFDIIHAHDWMTYPAGEAVARASGKRLVVHVHSTEFDRSGEHVNQAIYDIERRGMHTANKVITVSQYTKNIVVNRYGINPDKIEVVYNGAEPNGAPLLERPHNGLDKIVLFLGRITMQKGPEYFIAAAKRVLEKVDRVKFIMAGDGDMTHRMIEYAAFLGIGHKVFFTRFLRGAQVDQAYQMADLYVMPSVSEPFGITPLEALRQNVPVLISRQSGVSELLTHVLKVDFWDINQMANKMIAVLKRPALGQVLRQNGRTQVQHIRWEDSAGRIQRIYNTVLAASA